MPESTPSNNGAGTLRHRISPLDGTYDNFTIAGDWTDAGFNEGCVEAAVMSGRLAAHGFPVAWDDGFPGYRRFYTADGNGNRVEALAVT